jgi:hypothetical protein
VSTLVVETLKTELTHPFSLTLDVRYNIGALCPYLYMHNAPSGTFTFSIEDADDVEVFSQSFTSADIKTALSTTDNFAHVFYPVVPESPLFLEKGSYTAILSASGYSANSVSFLGWVRQHEDLVNELDYTPDTDFENPLSLKIKVLKQGIEP